MIILAIDPGLTGALCIYNPMRQAQSGLRWAFMDIPTTGEKAKRRVDAAHVRDFIMKWSPAIAVIENASTMPGQNAGMTRYMRACGTLEGIVGCLGVPIEFVAPQVWKPAMGLKGKAADKEASRRRALRLAPELADVLAQKKDHGRAEAALMAMWLWRTCE